METRKRNKMNNTLFLDNYIEQNLLSEQVSLAKFTEIVKNLINMTKTMGPKAVKFAEEMTVKIGRKETMKNLGAAIGQMKSIILAFFAAIRDLLQHILKEEVFYNVAFREAAKSSNSAVARMFRDGIQVSSVAIKRFSSAIGRMFNSVAAFIETHGARLFVRIFGESIAATARSLLRYIPWVWIGQTIYNSWIAPFIRNPLTGHEGEYASVDIFDSEGDFFLAWTNPAEATSNPANNPGQRMMRMAREDYEGPFHAKEWNIWPEEVQIAFCRQNGRRPKLDGGGFPSKGPTCGDLEVNNPEQFQIASFPGEEDFELMSTEEGEEYFASYPQNKDKVSESKTISESEFISSKKIIGEIDRIVDKLTNDKKLADKIKEKLKDIITQSNKQGPMGMERGIVVAAAKGMLSKLKDNPNSEL